MAFLENMYKEVILEHYKHPRNRGTLGAATVTEEGINPSCGDELELFLIIEEGTVTDIKFVGEGCAISQATASLMTEAVKGKSVTDVLELSTKFKEMLHGDPPDEALGNLKVMQGVAKLHARVKCAALPWVTLEQALKSEGRRKIEEER